MAATPISTEEIKALRDATGISVMQIKKALEEAGGDKEKALMILTKKSGEIAAKKSDRELSAGCVASYVHNTATIGAMVVLSCETDFVAKNPEFKALAYDIAMHVAAVMPKYLRKEDIAEIDMKNATELFQKEVDALDKPAEMKAKVLEGKISAYFKERILMEQSFIKNPDITVGTLISQAVQKFGEKTEITKMVRLSATGA
jgi:elongation factor Ts